MVSPLCFFVASMTATIVDHPPATGANSFYHPNRAPLHQTPLVQLPITAFKPGGWLRKQMELQRDGLMGHLGEISIWLTKKNNAWLSPTGQGDYGWEEVPYWLKGYARVGYVLGDAAMMKETKVWVDGTLGSARPDGDFGPIRYHKPGKRDLWAQMLMVQVLQGWYDKTGDKRVLPFLSNYFRWELGLRDEDFLKDYWENSRGGDNLASVYWLYNRTGESFLLELGTKIDRNTANWRMKDGLPNWHNVNVAQCFRAPSEYWQQSGEVEDLRASYRAFDWIRAKFGQVPGGMFGADENAREGYDDPRQATETCGFVEQIGSNTVMAALTANPKWTANSENVAFNSLPAAFMPDYRSLRYLTAPNMVVSDGANHAPGIDNGGPFLLMNPFSSRCCQHNHSSAWVNFLEGTTMATQDNGLAVLTLSEGAVVAKVGSGTPVTLTTKTHYPFEETATITVTTRRPARFPLYILVPAWADGASLQTPDGKVKGEPGKYVRIERTWANNDKVQVVLPMAPRVKVWSKMKDATSVDYGPLTLSLKIAEKYQTVDPTKYNQGDSGWQKTADKTKWPAFEILPGGSWNFGLVSGQKIDVKRKRWPADNMPFTLSGVPLVFKATGAVIPTWTLDKTGLVAVLPTAGLGGGKTSPITLVPMGTVRLRISSFPRVD
ncbi:MAG: glycoside hydrolase family 127 protein [Armatimonadetes bacterium]|nr:glycoside hydrolase family 127 protein [Armatimonadota bacterium]